MINFYCGKPRNGKSYAAMREIVRELLTGDRLIITNVAVKILDVWEYLSLNYPHVVDERFIRKGVHIADRIILIEDSQIPYFFAIRNNHGRLFDSISKKAWNEGVRPDYSKVNDSGVLYILDEVHITFGAREWANTGQEVIYY